MKPNVSSSKTASRPVVDVSELVEQLFVSMIAVNSYSLEKAWALRDGLRAQKLFDLSALGRMSEQEVYERLGKAGYEYIPYVQRLLAKRLLGASQVLGGEPERLARVASQSDLGDAMKALGRVPGVGPKVVERFLTLAKSPTPKR